MYERPMIRYHVHRRQSTKIDVLSNKEGTCGEVFLSSQIMSIQMVNGLAFTCYCCKLYSGAHSVTSIRETEAAFTLKPKQD